MVGRDKIRKLRKKLSAYTLLELSVVLMIIAIATAGGGVMFTASLKKHQVQQTQGKLEAVQKALLDFRCTYGRLPCPGDLTVDGVGFGNYGKDAATPGACTGGSPTANFTSGEIVAGIVPTKALKLRDEYALDGWGNRIMYAVDRRLTAQGAFNTLLPTDTTTRITVINNGGATITSQAAFVVWSSGENGHGAYPRTGGSTRIAVGTSITSERENCDCNELGVTTGFDSTFVDQLPTYSLTSLTTRHDDMVVYHNAYRESCYVGGTPAASPVNCGLPWGGTLAHGNSVTAYLAATVPFGQSCTSQSRTCSNGVLSGSYQFASCTVLPPSTDCALPWGGTLPHGNSVTAYQSATVPFGSSCVSQSRTCNNGVLSGSYQYQNCSVNPPADCTLPWGGPITHGNSVFAYQAATVPFGSSCVSHLRTCNNGVLSGSYQYPNCSVNPPASCNLPWGGSINHNDNVLAYEEESVPNGESCDSEWRSCNNGTLSGSYEYEDCTVEDEVYYGGGSEELCQHPSLPAPIPYGGSTWVFEQFWANPSCQPAYFTCDTEGTLSPEPSSEFYYSFSCGDDSVPSPEPCNYDNYLVSVTSPEGHSIFVFGDSSDCGSLGILTCNDGSWDSDPYNYQYHYCYED